MQPQVAHYLSVPATQRSWGLYVTGVGHAVIRPNQDYPPIPHPAGYAFRWKRGRVLGEYGLLCVVRGGGIFESSPRINLKVRAGNCLMLLPGKWHRYRPDRSVGWEEYWVTFHGDLAERWKREGFIRADSPLMSLANENLLSPIFEELLRLTEPGTHHKAIESAALCHLLIARALPDADATDKSRAATERLREAGDYLRLHSDIDIDLSQLAKKFGMSYSGFRRSFRLHFGESPGRFHQTARIAKVKQLLIETELPLKRIAEVLSYSTEFYMMQVFKRHTGLTPSQWRRQASSNF